MTVPETIVKALPLSSKTEIRAQLQIQAKEDSHYDLTAVFPEFNHLRFSQTVEAVLVSGGTGRFTGKQIFSYMEFSLCER